MTIPLHHFILLICELNVSIACTEYGKVKYIPLTSFVSRYEISPLQYFTFNRKERTNATFPDSRCLQENRKVIKIAAMNSQKKLD